MTAPSLLVRCLLRLYPRAYRARYGAEMEAFHRQEQEAGEGGWRYGVRLTMDHVRAAVAVRRGGGDGMLRRGWEDLRVAARALARVPAFTLFAVMTLALGIGATTAVFGVLDRIVLRPLPYPGSERMALVGIDARQDPGGLGPLSAPLLENLHGAPGAAEAVVGAAAQGVVLRDAGEPERLNVTRVSPGFFPFFGAGAAVGRLIRDEDDADGASKVAVLGYGFWRDRYGGDTAVVGRPLRLDDDTYTVVGVLSPEFVPPPEVVEDDARDVWVPMGLATAARTRGSFFIAAVARMRPDVTIADLDARADRAVADLYGSERPVFLLGGSVASYRDQVVGSVGNTLGRVMAAVVLLLLIACVNVASLLITRGTHRAHEMAVRSALGAGRHRLVRQLLGESVVMALAGGTLGSGLAWMALFLFRRYAPAGLPRLAEVSLDARGLGFSLALGVATVILFGLLPALRSTGASGPAAAMGTRGATGGRRDVRIRGALVSFETALAVVLAVGSALLAHDLVRLAHEDPGFRPEGLVALRVNLRPRFSSDEWAGVWERLLEGARGLPGVTAATVATQAPYNGTRVASTYRPEGTDDPEGVFVATTGVSAGYARTLGAKVVAGRGFVEADGGGRPVALVNEAFVRHYWPGESGLGKHVRSGSAEVTDEPDYEVVGVLADVRTRAGRPVPDQIYLPLPEATFFDMEVMVRTDADVDLVGPALRALVHRIDPTLPVTSVSTVPALAARGLARPRFYAGLFGGFAMVALLLAVVGVYGTTSYATSSRVREIGIRMALGAPRQRVVRGVVARTGAVVGVGVAVGLAGAALGARAMVDQLTYVAPTDSVSYALVAVVVLAAGTVAAWVPAGRAGRVDPATTLREER